MACGLGTGSAGGRHTDRDEQHGESFLGDRTRKRTKREESTGIVTYSTKHDSVDLTRTDSDND